jgi:hypothetical protein
MMALVDIALACLMALSCVGVPMVFGVLVAYVWQAHLVQWLYCSFAYVMLRSRVQFSLLHFFFYI